MVFWSKKIGRDVFRCVKLVLGSKQDTVVITGNTNNLHIYLVIYLSSHLSTSKVLSELDHGLLQMVAPVTKQVLSHLLVEVTCTHAEHC